MKKFWILPQIKLSLKQKIVKRVKTILENGRNYSQSAYKTVVIIKILSINNSNQVLPNI